MSTANELKDGEQPFVPQLAENATVRVIGLGGVGGIVARYLSMFLASLDRGTRLVLIDGDEFEPGNATRMFFSAHGNKAAVTRADLIDRFRDSSLALVAVEEYVTPENVARLLGAGSPDDVTILAVDNHATRKLVGDYCATLDDVCLISGGNDGVGADSSGRARRGTFGNCQVFVRRAGVDVIPSLAKFHPEIASPADRLPTDLSCTELVASVPQILFANLMTAASCLNAAWLHLCGRLHYGELCFDIADGKMSPLPLPVKLSLVRSA